MIDFDRMFLFLFSFCNKNFFLWFILVRNFIFCNNFYFNKMKLFFLKIIHWIVDEKDGWNSKEGISSFHLFFFINFFFSFQQITAGDYCRKEDDHSVVECRCRCRTSFIPLHNFLEIYLYRFVDLSVLVSVCLSVYLCVCMCNSSFNLRLKWRKAKI